MATAEQIMHDEFFDLVMSKNLTADVLKDPEIVAFLQTKNLTPIDIKKSFEEAFRYGLKRFYFELEKARLKKHLLASFKAINRTFGDF